jgi:hypothetical protein
MSRFTSFFSPKKDNIPTPSHAPAPTIEPAPFDDTVTEILAIIQEKIGEGTRQESVEKNEEFFINIKKSQQDIIFEQSAELDKALTEKTSEQDYKSILVRIKGIEDREILLAITRNTLKKDLFTQLHSSPFFKKIAPNQLLFLANLIIDIPPILEKEVQTTLYRIIKINHLKQAEDEARVKRYEAALKSNITNFRTALNLSINKIKVLLSAMPAAEISTTITEEDIKNIKEHMGVKSLPQTSPERNTIFDSPPHSPMDSNTLYDPLLLTPLALDITGGASGGEYIVPQGIPHSIDDLMSPFGSPTASSMEEIEESITAEEEIMTDRINLRSGNRLSRENFDVTEGRAQVTVEDLQFKRGKRYYNNMFFTLHFTDSPDKPRIFEDGAEIFLNSFNKCTFTNVRFNTLKATKFLNCTFIGCDFPKGFGGEFTGSDTIFDEDCRWPAGIAVEDAIKPQQQPTPGPHITDIGVRKTLERIKIRTLGPKL